MKYSPCGECEIISFGNCEIPHSARREMKFAHVRIGEYFTFVTQTFHGVAISPARRANFVKKALARASAFFMELVM